MKDQKLTPKAMKQAIAIKYQNFLSRRKFALVCKTQSSYFDPDKEVWLPRNICCLEVDPQLPNILSNYAVDKFVKSLDIGTITQIPGVTGISSSRTDFHDY